MGLAGAWVANHAAANRLERFQAKWRRVRVKKTRQIKNLEPHIDSIETEKALEAHGVVMHMAFAPTGIVAAAVPAAPGSPGRPRHVIALRGIGISRFPVLAIAAGEIVGV